MKKQWIAAILAVLMVVTCTACGEADPTVPTTEAVTTTFEGISVKVLNAELQDVETILEVQWQNRTDYSVMYGEMFSLQKWDNEKWVSCPVNENTGFITVGYKLEPGKSVAKFYKLRWLYGSLEDGQYRFVTTCTVMEGENNGECKLTADFVLGEKTSDRVLEAPPELWIVHSGKEMTAKGAYTWNYQLEDGKWACTNADASHPLLMKDRLNVISPGDPNVILEFGDWPDDYTVRCWPDTADDTDAASQAVMNWNNNIELKMGGYIYEVTATWNDDGDGYYGTVTYVFYAAPAVLYDVMPIHAGMDLYIAGEILRLDTEREEIIQKILDALDYDENAFDDLLPEYRLILASGDAFGIHLKEGYVSGEKGQAKLSAEQLKDMSAIIDWALEKTKAKQPLDSRL